MFGQIDWMEIAKLSVAALTPIMTGILSILVVRMGTKLDVSKQVHQELLRKRLELFEDVAPKLNDIHCFFQAIGHWAELSPDEVIKRKRAIDRSVEVNRYLFRSDFWDAYRTFETAHFDLFRRSAKQQGCGWIWRICASASASSSIKIGCRPSRPSPATTPSKATSITP
jgi:hypothetical protein